VDLAKAIRLMLLRRPTDSDKMTESIAAAAAATAARHGIPFDRAELEQLNEATGAGGTLFTDPVFTGHSAILNHRCHPRLTPTIFQATSLAAEILAMNAAGQVIRKEERQQMMDNLMSKEQAAKEQVAKYRQRSEKLSRKLESVKAARPVGRFEKLRAKLRGLLGRDR